MENSKFLNRFVSFSFLSTLICGLLACHEEHVPNQTLLFNKGDNHIYSYNLKSRSEKQIDFEIETYEHENSRIYLSPDNRLFAYVAQRESESAKDILIRSIDGNVLFAITNQFNLENEITSLVWSPSTDKIAYTMFSSLENLSMVYVINVDTEENIAVSINYPPSTVFEDLQWSPDGRFLSMAVYGMSNSIGLDVFDSVNEETMRLDSGLTTTLYGGVNWAPNSQALLFLSDQSNPGFHELIAAKADGVERSFLKSHEEIDSYTESFHWSQSSERIAFATRPLVPAETPFDRDIFTINSNGLERLKINYPESNELTTSSYQWASNVDSVYYYTIVENNKFDLYKVNEDGTNHLKINNVYFANDTVANFRLSPDGNKLAYLATKFGEEAPTLIVAEPDGTQAVNVTVDLSNTVYPTGEYYWSPNSLYIAYFVQHKNSSQQDLYVATSDGAKNNFIYSDIDSDNFNVGLYWTPDSSYLAFLASKPNNLVVANKIGTTTQVVLDASQGEPGMIGWIE